MRSLCKFLLLEPSARWLLLKTGLLLWAVRLGLWLLPLPRLRRLLAKLRPSQPMAPEDLRSIEKIVWAVTIASRYVPAATCLTQALVGQILLAHYGEAAFLQIGVTKNEAGELEAHAWVESRGRVVIGDSQELFRYARLPSLEEKLL
jgi:Transglutaminase-like superfamily